MHIGRTPSVSNTRDSDIYKAISADQDKDNYLAACICNFNLARTADQVKTKTSSLSHYKQQSCFIYIMQHICHIYELD
jgi:hypothetical protein